MAETEKAKHDAAEKARTEAADAKAKAAETKPAADTSPKADTPAKAPVTADKVSVDQRVKDRAAQLESEGMGSNEALATAKAEAAQRQRADEESKANKTRAAKPGDLARAGESGDPVVHKLLADRQGLVSNLASMRPEPSALDEDAAGIVEAQIRDIDDRLAELGYTAS